jgi:phosphocarrier protein HPr
MTEPLRRPVKIVSPHGLHMRPIHDFVEAASRFQCEVFVSNGKQRVNGKSALMLMGLAATEGSELLLELEGPDADQAADVLVAALVRVYPEDE